MADLPFSVEYAKSGRAACKSCKSNIDKDELRMAIMIQSMHFDGRIPNWYHFGCFWKMGKSAQLKSEAEIHHFENIRWEDQERIRKMMDGKGGRKSVGGAAAASTSFIDVKITDFQIDAAKTGNAKCRACDNKVLKKELRVGRQEGGKTLWYHLSCFAKKREEFAFNFDPKTMPGYDQLDDDDKALVVKKLEQTKRPHSGEETEGEKPAKKAKMDNGNGESSGDKQMMALKKQTDDLWKLRDELKSTLSKNELSELLTHNNQEIPKGEDKILDRLTDCMLFGALEKCTECKGGQLVYSSTNSTYVCTGHVSGFTGCQFKTATPKRVPFTIPDDYDDHEFLSTFEFKAGRARVFNPRASISGISGGSESSGASSLSRPLANLKFVVLAGVSNEIKEKIREAGGTVVPKLDSNTIAVVAPKEADQFKGHKAEGLPVVEAKNAHVHVVTEDFLNDVNESNLADQIEKFKKCDWGSDVGERIAKARQPATSSKSSLSKSNAYKSQKTSQKVVVKGGAAVDPDFDEAAVTHVYQDKGKNVFNVVLSKADAQRGHNSCYKLQLLEHDQMKTYWVFRAWGRTGTTIGGTKADEFDSDLEAAKKQFYDLYLEKTGNNWDERHNFEKKPHCFYPVDVDYGQDEEEETKGKVAAGSQSKLPKEVQDLIKVIFDIEQMKNTMKEFEIDLQKMPLGKLSKKHIQDAYKVLTELQEELAGGKNQTKILDCTNRFFTLIPHDFGLAKPPLLDNTAAVKDKTLMLDNLLEIEVAYSILKGGTGDRDPIDVHYEKLKTKIAVLDKASDEFDMIKKYVKNTHASTHRQYDLVVEEVFKIDREGEADRYAPFKGMHNRMLLWHGSRTTNYVGILSQGLRIAPPEAPVTGYMFGKGVYFADMVSKSANYCYTNQTNPMGLLMLCEVALGEMQEYKNAHNVTKLPAGKNSVKGVGQTAPNPAAAVTLKNGTVVPIGEGVAAGNGASSLLYNEYIVYDVSQVNIKYLLKLNFKYKY